MCPLLTRDAAPAPGPPPVVGAHSALLPALHPALNTALALLDHPRANVGEGASRATDRDATGLGTASRTVSHAAAPTGQDAPSGSPPTTVHAWLRGALPAAPPARPGLAGGTTVPPTAPAAPVAPATPTAPPPAPAPAPAAHATQDAGNVDDAAVEASSTGAYRAAAEAFLDTLPGGASATIEWGDPDGHLGGVWIPGSETIILHAQRLDQDLPRTKDVLRHEIGHIHQNRAMAASGMSLSVLEARLDEIFGGEGIERSADAIALLLGAGSVRYASTFTDAQYDAARVLIDDRVP